MKNGIDLVHNGRRLCRQLAALIAFVMLATGYARAQGIRDSTLTPIEGITQQEDNSGAQDKERDVIDLFHALTHYKADLPLYQAQKRNFEFTLVPAGGYTLQTGFAILLAANTLFYLDKEDRSITSTALVSLSYTQYRQVILPVYINLSTKKYNLISDFRFMDYPSQTFGLGANTKVAEGYSINFSYLKIHQSFLRSVSPNLFVGAGYYLDHFWNIAETNPPSANTSFKQYGLRSNETASGISLQGTYDTRGNQVNPLGGWYASVRYRINTKWMGSTSDWHSTILELRKYIRFPKQSPNIIALWNYNWITTYGRPPYLLLPSTGWDDFFNTGRGYIQGRYRAMNMSYAESEYRFRLINNGLLGAVIFANVQTFSNDLSSQYRKLIPGGGAGLRIKINKHSRTNLAVDYAFGAEGSRGFFINLGEVF